MINWARKLALIFLLMMILCIVIATTLYADPTGSIRGRVTAEGDETEPVSEINFTPGNPINVQAGVSWEF